MFPYDTGGLPSFSSIIREQVDTIMAEYGLKAVTDGEQTSRSGNSFASMFSFSGDALAKLKATTEWDDRPAIDKVIDMLIESAKHDSKPATDVSRILGYLPDTCTIVLMVAISFTPSAAADVADLTKVGRWSIALRDIETKVTKNWQGDALDRQELQDAFDGMIGICRVLRDKYHLKSIVPAARFGGGIAGLGPFVEAPSYGIPQPISEGPQG